MGLIVKVDGGTGAGRRKPLKETPGVWACLCWDRPLNGIGCVFDETAVMPEPARLKVNAGYLVRCPDCGMTRP